MACDDGNVSIELSEMRTMPRVRIDTGNIHRHTELFKRIFKNSAEELLANIKYEMEMEGGPFIELRQDGTVLLSGNEMQCRKQKDDLKEMHEHDMRITLKLFMSALNMELVEESIDAALNQLNVKSISQLIIAFPADDDLCIDPTIKSEVGHWLARILPLWHELEKLVLNRKVYTLGVADLDYEQLKALYEAAVEVRPMIDHYNIESCCTVPQELRDYAKEKDIQLLTHNDPHLCCICETLPALTSTLFGENSNYSMRWIARHQFFYFLYF